MAITVRYMNLGDLKPVADCERERNKFVDEDFGVEQVREWAWDEEDLVEAVRRYKNGDTRAWVAEDEHGIWGAMLYELHQDCYEIKFFTAHPKAPEETRKVMLDFLAKKAKESETRRLINAVVRDGDYVPTLKFFMENGFKVTPRREDGTWFCQKLIAKEKKPLSYPGMQ